jgi:hypothetical protein
MKLRACSLILLLIMVELVSSQHRNDLASVCKLERYRIAEHTPSTYLLNTRERVSAPTFVAPGTKQMGASSVVSINWIRAGAPPTHANHITSPSPSTLID